MKTIWICLVLTATGACSYKVEPAPEAVEQAMELISNDEGFRPQAYLDTQGFETIGYGTRLPITEVEGNLLLRHRLLDDVDEFVHAWPEIPTLSIDLQAHFYNAVYQLGPNRLEHFVELRKALDRGDCKAAAKEALDSVWNRQTPKRAQELADALQAGCEGDMK